MTSTPKPSSKQHAKAPTASLLDPGKLPAKSRKPKSGAGIDAENRIYDAVLNAVMHHRLLPGTKLAESSLCELFRVSRTIVRQALQRLAHDHVVELRVNRGAVVASPSPGETREVFTARRSIEAAILPLVVANASAAQIAALRQQMQAAQAALDSHDHTRWTQLAGQFHLMLADIADNSILKRFLTELLTRCSLIVALYEAPGDAPCEHAEHMQLVDLIERKDTAGALNLMHHHLVDLERRIRIVPQGSALDLAAILGIS